ncbi:MAG: YbdK family carboxylate-amine ligase [Actinomycetota bacterium]|nr:YbdK family carboxylate-amine ligase [Actinomycetota bacterium]MDQ5808481.1 YbdK family carboxylate-amine ligase [Actinomycetota bacterium]
MAHGIPEVNFGRGPSYRLGVEEEFVLVDASTGAVSHTGSEVLPRLPLDSPHGRFAPDTYEAEIELKAPVSADAAEAADHLAHLRAELRAAGASAIGAGLHPDAVFGDVVHVAGERYAAIVAMLRGLITRTPTAATHVHVGMPDPATAILACNGLRSHLPLLQALSANSPFWFGQDSGFDSARAQLFRAYPRAAIPRAFRGWPDYERTIEAIVAGAEIADYTFLWWDVRPHPLLGTVEVRAMDAQSDLRNVAALAALVHGLALHEVASPSPAVDSGILMESSFRAARDGLRATIWFDGALHPVADVARRAVALARRHLDTPALDEVERILGEGNGADRQRAVHAREGMRGLVAHLAAETLGGEAG